MSAAPAAGPPEDEQVPGLAGERTDLAWNRSGVSLGVLAAALLRRIWERSDVLTPRFAIFGALLAATATFFGAQVWAHTAVRRTIEGRPVEGGQALRRITVATVLACAAALLVALTA